MPNTPSEKIDAEHGAERRARGGAEDVGRDQRIAEQALECGAGDRERRADQHRRDHARPAHLQITFSTAGGAGRPAGRAARPDTSTSSARLTG